MPECFNQKKAQAYTLQTRRAKDNQVLPSELGTSLFVQIDSLYYGGWNYPSDAAIAARPCQNCSKTRADHHNDKCYVRDARHACVGFVLSISISVC